MINSRKNLNMLTIVTYRLAFFGLAYLKNGLNLDLQPVLANSSLHWVNYLSEDLLKEL